MMHHPNRNIFTLNGGSSSIKFSLYTAGVDLLQRASGNLFNLGSKDVTLLVKTDEGKSEHRLGEIDLKQGLAAIEVTVAHILGDGAVDCVGHRIVHGGPDHARPVILDDEVMAGLERYIPFAPLHQPHNLEGVRAAQHVLPSALQVGCFDTAFHRGHEWLHETYALPRRYYDAGVRRYGFHGLSYTYISQKLEETDTGQHGRTVVCHLGSGASMCAMHNGKSVTSTMGFSALEGLPMGTRCGRLDPGVMLYMLDQEGLTSRQITDLLYKQSGLLGLSGLSNDMHKLEEASAPEARQAIDYFIMQVRRELGAMAVVLGGLDTVVFCGGIGENSAMVREGVCADMGWLGIELDSSANAKNAPVISSGSTVVRVIPTDEEYVIASACAGFLSRQTNALRR